MLLTARGDVVFSSPMVRALRRTYPEARISWFGEAHTKELIEHHSELHRVFSWDRGRWKRLLKRGRFLMVFREVLELVRGLREERFDLAIDMQGMIRSGVIALVSGARTRIVMRPKEGSHVLFDHVVDRYRNQGNPAEICSHYRYLAQELGLESGDFRMEVPLLPDDRQFARRIIEENGLVNGFVVAIPYTTRPQKHWFEDRWAGFMERVRDEFGLPTVILGGPSDREADARIRSMTSAEPVSLVGNTTLRQASGIIEQARLVVGVDTGLTHIGIAFDRPTIGIWGSNIPYTETFSRKTRLLVHWLDCVPCKGNPTCDGDFTCLKLISVDEVMNAAAELIGVDSHRTA